MAVTKILARKGRLDVGVRYVLNGDKTQEQILTARLNCEPDREVRQMLETKRDYGKEAGVQYYHMIQSFRPGEITPEELESARRSLISAVRAGLDTPAALDDWYIGMSIEPCDDPVTMLQKLPALTVEDVVRAARRITTDTIYFLKGDEA